MSRPSSKKKVRLAPKTSSEAVNIKGVLASDGALSGKLSDHSADLANGGVKFMMGSLPRAAFDVKRAELSKNWPSGKLIRESQITSGFLHEQVFENWTLSCFDDKLFVIHGAIRAKWEALGGRKWGLPTTDELDAKLGQGRYTLFELKKSASGGSRNAAIYWSNVTGAHEITGAIYDRFAGGGGVKTFGFPVCGTGKAAKPKSFYAHFKRVYQDDQFVSIYIAPNASQPVVVRGAIRSLWEAMDWERSILGFPKADSFGPADHRRQYFDGGTVIWTSHLGAHVETPDYHIRYRGLHCVKSANDQKTPNVEFYFFSTAVPRVLPGNVLVTKMPKHAKEYDKLRTGRWRHDNVVIYSGNSDSVVLKITGAERDHGNPDHYLGEIQAVSKKVVTEAITGLAALIGGPAAAAGKDYFAVAGDFIGGQLGKIINNVLDTGDDPLHPTDVPLNIATIGSFMGAAPRMAAAVTADGKRAEPIPYHFKARLTGGGNILDLYFEVVRGRG